MKEDTAIDSWRAWHEKIRSTLDININEKNVTLEAILSMKEELDFYKNQTTKRPTASHEKIQSLEAELAEYKKKIEKCHSWTKDFIMEQGSDELALTIGHEIINRFRNKEYTFTEPFGDGEQTVLYYKFCIS